MATVQLGDIFNVPVEGDNCGVGVVASKWNKELYIVIFDHICGCNALPKDITSLEPLIASSSLDAKIWHGHWKVFGNTTVLDWIAQPIYKIKEPSGWIGESFDRKFRTAISDDQAEALKFRKCVAPVRIERALQAYAGHGDWTSDYDELLYSEVLKSQRVLGRNGDSSSC